MIADTFGEHFSISIFGRKSVCHLTYSVSNLYMSHSAHSRTSSLAKLTSFLARIPTPYATFVTQLKCYTSSITFITERSSVVITICTSLQRQLLRPINAWYFYTDISAGSNGNFGGKTGRTSDCLVCSF